MLQVVKLICGWTNDNDNNVIDSNCEHGNAIVLLAVGSLLQ